MEKIRQTVKRVWGYDTLLPLQEEAMRAVLARRDSIVILPTGGGKSLCYQAPAAAMGTLTVVVSPLIALMKDQVDGLTTAGGHRRLVSQTTAPSLRPGPSGSGPA
jgi:ATP-dependent DNA helicase RecQ